MPARVFYSENLTCFDAELQIRKLVSVDIVRRDQSVTRSSSEAAPAFEPPSLVAVLGQRRLQREWLSRFGRLCWDPAGLLVGMRRSSPAELLSF